jgi:hypothetical protein
MTTPLWIRIDDLMQEIDELLRQKDALQSLYDFADFIETHNLIDAEIDRLRKELREAKEALLSNREALEGVEVCEEEEEEEVPNSLRKWYTIEHIIMGCDGVVRPVEPGDLDLDRNRYVREAFRMIYEFRRRMDGCSVVKDGKYVRRRTRVYDKRS